MQRHKRRESMKKVVTEIRKGGWFTPKQLVAAINKHEKEKPVNERTVRYDLAGGTYIGIFKHDKTNGQYAWIDYVDEELKILEARKDFLDSHPSLRGKPLSAFSIDEIIDNAGARAGKDPQKQDFRELAFRVLSRHTQENTN